MSLSSMKVALLSNYLFFQVSGMVMFTISSFLFIPISFITWWRLIFSWLCRRVIIGVGNRGLWVFSGMVIFTVVEVSGSGISYNFPRWVGSESFRSLVFFFSSKLMLITCCEKYIIEKKVMIEIYGQNVLQLCKNSDLNGALKVFGRMREEGVT